MFNILLIEGDIVASYALSRFLQNNQHHVVTARTIKDSKVQISKTAFDIVIIDRKLPDGDGLNIIDFIKENNLLHSTGVIVTSALGTTKHIIQALKRHADDYLTKPINYEELLFRINAILGRIHCKKKKGSIEVDSKKKTQIFHEFSLCSQTRLLKKGEIYNAALTESEFKMLTMLINNQGTPVSRAQLLQAHSNRIITEESRTIDVIIGRLRKKLNDLPSQPKLLLTIRGKGYMIPHQQ